MIHREKLLLIIQREYLVRIRSKVFIISTILAPVVMIALLVLPALITIYSAERTRLFPVYDETGVVGNMLVESDPDSYRLAQAGADTLRVMLSEGRMQGYIYIPHDVLEQDGKAYFFHDGSVGMTTSGRIRSDIRRTVREIRLDQMEISSEIRSALAHQLPVDNVTVTDKGEETGESGFFAFLGMIMGFIIYGAMIGYGAIIMRSVMEEKTNRIVEVIASAVHPFELLLGKVIGIALLGLTQFAIWAVAGSAILFAATPLASFFSGVPESGSEVDAAFAIPQTDPLLWIGFIVFFLLGFLIYSSLFAAVGASVEQESDSQQLQLPIIMLIIIPLLFLFPISDDPTSSLAVGLSMVPFFAPILMPVRMAVISVPLWQLASTLLLMILFFLFLIWVSARIYRTGILMYGKKATLAEMIRWARQA